MYINLLGSGRKWPDTPHKENKPNYFTLSFHALCTTTISVACHLLASSLLRLLLIGGAQNWANHIKNAPANVDWSEITSPIFLLALSLHPACFAAVTALFWIMLNLLPAWIFGSYCTEMFFKTVCPQPVVLHGLILTKAWGSVFVLYKASVKPCPSACQDPSERQLYPTCH